ncbi:MAG: hypothetical protein KBC62_01140 [Candidatus Pacebacteria bacterium]|nr:hypothetical protein [Candidatus Paceibacterota bacterium]MBP9842588.1 hypothetical protein [Candidatus Paceibacterota bacterium]
MERMTTAEEVQEDIDINTREGLQAFSRHTEDAYTELIEYIKAHSGESSHNQLENVSHLYETLKEKLNTAFLLKDEGGDVDETLANEIQTHYNELIDILDGIESIEAVVENEVVVMPEVTPIVVDTLPIKTVSESVPVELVPEDSMTQDFVKPEVEQVMVAEEEIVIKEIEEIVAGPQVEPDKELVVDESATVEKSKLNTLEEKTEMLIEQAEALLAKYQEINEVVSPDAVLNVGQHYYKQLVITTDRARTTFKSIREYLDRDDKVTELTSEHFEDAVDEISDNLIQLDKGLGGFFEKDEEIPLVNIDIKRQPTGAIEVAKEAETEEKIVPITLVKKPELIASNPPRPKAIHNSPTKPSIERVERAYKGEWGGVIEKVLAIPRYGKFVAYNFPSVAQFEAMVRREIQGIEAPSKFDSAFGFAYKSAFYDFLRSMTVKEVVDFDSQSRDVVRAKLQERDIKYEVYLDWIDSLNSMIDITHAHPTITFGELFIRAELETLLQHDETMAA